MSFSPSHRRKDGLHQEAQEEAVSAPATMNLSSLDQRPSQAPLAIPESDFSASSSSTPSSQWSWQPRRSPFPTATATILENFHHLPNSLLSSSTIGASSSSSASIIPPYASRAHSDLSPHRRSGFYHRGRSISILSANEEEGEAHAATSSPHFPSFAAHDTDPSEPPTSIKDAPVAKLPKLLRGKADPQEKETATASLHDRSHLTQKNEQAGADHPDGEGDVDEPEESAVSGAYLVSYFVAGGAAGAASRTVVSPLERLKIIMQVQPSSAGKGKAAYNGVISGLVKMWQEEGFAGYMRGNGINCLRIVPYSAVQFCTYEIAKDKLSHGSAEGEMTTAKRLLAGALAGTASCVATFPLDLVRARISIASASLYADAKADVMAGTTPVSQKAAVAPAKLSRAEMRAVIAERQKRVPGIWAMTRKVYIEEGGIRGLYRGCIPTAAGVAPYVAINFAAYEAMRKYFVEASIASGGEGEIGTAGKLMCGALAGSISQSVTFPLDVLRRRMQVAGMKDSKLGYSDKSAIDAIRNILRSDGFLGLYRGLWPNLLKVAPSIGTSFLVYETVQAWVHPHKHHHHHHQQQHHHHQHSHQQQNEADSEEEKGL